jgi:hypothetical protein
MKRWSGQRCYPLPLMAAVLLLCARTLLPQGAGKPQASEAIPAGNIAKLAQSVLPPGHELVHPPVALQFGPPGKHVVVLHAPKDETAFSGIVLLMKQEGWRKFEIPGPKGIPGQFEYEVKAVFAENADRDPARELIVLYSYHRNGSTADDGTACLVYRWNGKSFGLLESVAAQLAGAKTAAQVRARLRALVGSEPKGVEK